MPIPRSRRLSGVITTVIALPPLAAVGTELPDETLRDLYRSQLQPQAGSIAASNLVAPDVRSAGWSPMFGAPPSGAGMSSSVNALAVYNGELIAAGDFLRAGGATVGRVAAWDGASWSAFRTGLNDRAFALTVWNGLLVVGGQFIRADGLQVGGVAAWDGAQWSALGGPGGTTYALTTYQGQLVAGGTFAGGVKIWNGSTWVAPGTTGGAPGLPGVVFALTTYNAGGVEYLVAGGIFSSAGLNNIAKWNGTAWSALRAGTSDWVHAVCARNDTLFVGGRFTSVDATISCRGIARWVPNTTGSGSWSAI